MKRTTILAVTLLALALCACDSKYNKNEIRTNALGYLQAVGDYHFDEALPYASRHTREETIPAFNYLMESADTAYINSNRPSVFTLNKVKRLDDTTARVYYHKSTPIKEVDDSLTVIYEEGHWLADVHLGPIPYYNPKQKGMPHVMKNPGKLRKVPLSELKHRKPGLVTDTLQGR